MSASGSTTGITTECACGSRDEAASCMPKPGRRRARARVDAASLEPRAARGLRRASRAMASSRSSAASACACGPVGCSECRMRATYDLGASPACSSNALRERDHRGLLSLSSSWRGTRTTVGGVVGPPISPRAWSLRALPRKMSSGGVFRHRGARAERPEVPLVDEQLEQARCDPSSVSRVPCFTHGDTRSRGQRARECDSERVAPRCDGPEALPAGGTTWS